MCCAWVWQYVPELHVRVRCCSPMRCTWSACGTFPHSPFLFAAPPIARPQMSAPRFRLPEERVRSVAVDTLRGLAFLHARQVCCRDVKLDNIMLRRKGGQAVLVDLGLACKADPSGTLKGRAAQLGGVGSMSNMAPEMRGVLKVPVAAPSGKAGKAREQRVPITVKCDVFSLGQSLANSTGVPMADIKSAPLRDLVTQLVARWPDARPSAEAALQHPFLAAAQ